MYYTVRKPKGRLKSTVKIRHWHKNEIEIYEENSFNEELDGNNTVKYFIGSTYRTSSNEELGGCWIFRSRENFNPWKIGQCKHKHNKTVPWIWRKRMALPRVKFNFKIGYWEIDNNKWETDVYLIKMELNKTLKIEN